MSRYKAGIMKPGFNPLAAVIDPYYAYTIYGWGYNLYAFDLPYYYLS